MFKILLLGGALFILTYFIHLSGYLTAHFFYEGHIENEDDLCDEYVIFSFLS